MGAYIAFLETECFIVVGILKQLLLYDFYILVVGAVADGDVQVAAFARCVGLGIYLQFAVIAVVVFAVFDFKPFKLVDDSAGCGDR